MKKDYSVLLDSHQVESREPNQKNQIKSFFIYNNIIVNDIKNLIIQCIYITKNSSLNLYMHTQKKKKHFF